MSQESRAPGLRSPSGPNIRPITSGWPPKSHAWGCVWLMRVDGAELGEELCRLGLEVPRQRRRREVHLLQLDVGVVVLVELEDDVRDAGEVGIDGAVEEDLFVRQGEAALERVVIAGL